MKYFFTTKMWFSRGSGYGDWHVIYISDTRIKYPEKLCCRSTIYRYFHTIIKLVILFDAPAIRIACGVWKSEIKYFSSRGWMYYITKDIFANKKVKVRCNEVSSHRKKSSATRVKSAEKYMKPPFSARRTLQNYPRICGRNFHKHILTQGAYIVLT